MTKRKFASDTAMRVTALMTGMSTLSCMPQSEPKSEAKNVKKPNILLFIVDDLGWADVGCNGATYYETPNIDRLATEGMLFTQAYAGCTVCSPTRAGILTGKSPARLHLTDAILPESLVPKDRKLLPPKSLDHLPLEEFTLSEALKEEGYATGHIGKWHLGGHGFSPTEQGSDINIAGDHWGQPTSYFAPFSKHWRTGKMTERIYPNLRDATPGEHLSDVLADHAIDFIDTNKDRPFFLNFSFFSVHSPIQAKEELVEKYKKKTPPYEDMIPEYAAMIETMDTNIGKVISKLKELNIYDDTIVVFTSDNGGCYNNYPLRGKKGHLYEGGIREPLLIKWKNVTQPSSVCDVPVITTDFYPTFLDMVGAEQRPKQHLDGKNLAPLLKGGNDVDRDALYWYFPHHSKWDTSRVPAAAVRKGNWKLIHLIEEEKFELYNLKDDIGEKNNLIDSKKDIADALKLLLRNWKKEVNALEPKKNPDF